MFSADKIRLALAGAGLVIVALLLAFGPVGIIAVVLFIIANGLLLVRGKYSDLIGSLIFGSLLFLSITKQLSCWISREFGETCFPPFDEVTGWLELAANTQVFMALSFILVRVARKKSFRYE